MTDNLTTIFVYGTLKRGFHNHSLLEEAKFITEATTLNEYTMKSLGGFPAVSLSEETSTIKGELFDVTPSQLERVHQLEGYTGDIDTWYHLELIETDKGSAFIYHMDTSYPVIADGVWL